MDTTSNAEAMVSSKPNFLRWGLVLAGIGLGSALAYLFSRTQQDRVSARKVREHQVDDRGTGQDKAARILLNLRNRAFEASDEKLALALGRPVNEITAWNSGVEVIDDDVIMKARGIALVRGVRVE